MQYRPFIQRLTPWLTAYLLLVSIGLPLQRVYCACAGEAWLTVIAKTHQCHHAHPQDDHRVADNEPAEVAPPPTKERSCHGTDTTHSTSCTPRTCGDAEVLIAQLDAEFTLAAATPDPGLRSVLPSAAFIEWAPLVPVTAAGQPPEPAPPDLPSGRTLLVKYQTFLI